MEGKLNKHYFEIYAALTLSRFGIPLEQIAFRDRPDLQCDHLDIGVEVTQSISTYMGKFRSLINSYFSKGYTLEQIKEEMQREKMAHVSVTDINGRVCVSPHDELIDLSTYLTELKEHIEEKINKLNNGYKKFRQNGLYIFTDTGLIEYNEMDGFFSSNLHRVENGFDLYYINCIDKIYLYETKTRVLKKQPISEEELSKIHRKALELTEKE